MEGKCDLRGIVAIGKGSEYESLKEKTPPFSLIFNLMVKLTEN